MKVVWLFQLAVTLMFVLSCELGKFHFDLVMPLRLPANNMLHVVVLIITQPRRYNR